MMHPAVRAALVQRRCGLCNMHEPKYSRLVYHYRSKCKRANFLVRSVAAAAVLAAECLGVVERTCEDLSVGDRRRGPGVEAAPSPVGFECPDVVADSTLDVEAESGGIGLENVVVDVDSTLSVDVGVLKCVGADCNAERWALFWKNDGAIDELPANCAKYRSLALQVCSVGVLFGGGVRDLLKAALLFASEEKDALLAFCESSFKDLDVSVAGDPGTLDEATSLFRAALKDRDLGASSPFGNGIMEFAADGVPVQVVHRPVFDRVAQPLAYSVDGLYLSFIGGKLVVGGMPDLFAQCDGVSIT
jgi:hypothetical protein